MKRHSSLSRRAGAALSLVLLAACSKDSSTTSPPAPKVASVAVTPGAGTIIVGGTVQLTASTLDSTGAALTGHSISWSSSNAAVATVSATGLVTGVSGGVATISATSEGKVGTATVTVANAFNPTTSTTLAGTQRYTSINIPAGVVITVTGALDLSASGLITIAGTLSGNCMGISVTGDAATAVTGTLDNRCSDPNADGADLTIVGKKGISVSGATIKSTGNILITNDLTLTAANFPAPPPLLDGSAAAMVAGLGVRSEIAQIAGPDCAFSGPGPVWPPARAGAPSEKQFLSGGSGKVMQMSCRGNGEIGGILGALITGQDGGAGGTGTSVSNTFAEARAGDGGNGGDVRLWTTGNLTFLPPTPVTLISGRGGDGGVATATGLPNNTLTRGTNASATGGKGGMPGLLDIRAGGAINITTALIIVVGRAGNGGAGTATASDGNDAGTSAAQAGGDAAATGGQGGSTPKLSFVSLGAVAGAPVVTGGNGGNGGTATANAGRGGNGNEAFPNGGRGGNAALNTNIAGNGSSAGVGNGGNANLRDLTGALIGTGGNGSAGIVAVGMGGAGWSDCNFPRKPGGAGGGGGSASGRDGSGGTGTVNGTPGGITFNAMGNGGKGGDGAGPGGGGAPGSDGTSASGVKNNLPSSFNPGLPGNACPPLNAQIKVKDDPNGHEPFVGYTGITKLTVTIEGNNITITGAAPWVTVTGTVDAMGNFTATGSGTVAGFPNVPAKVVGTIAADGSITGTIQLGQSTPPTGLPNGPVTYTLTATKP